MRKIVAIITACLMLLASSAPALAGLAEEMDDMFGSMINVTGAQAYLGQRRGVVTGGRVTVRNKIMNAQLLGFIPPRIDAGCGGIDYFAGSFSFISADEFVALLRSIASNAAGYAFKLALGAMCPSCQQVMSDLQKMVSELNGLAGNSCKLAQWGVDQLGGKNLSTLGNSIDEGVGSMYATVKGYFKDNFGGQLDKIGKKSANNVIPPDQFADADFAGNVVWKALASDNRGNAPKNWLRDPTGNFLEMIMSMTGTIIITKSEEEGVGPTVTTLPKILDFHDLMYGKDGNSRIVAYTCDDATKCLTPLKTDITFKGMYATVNEVLLGDGTGANVGLVAKYAANTGTLTDKEKQFVEVVPVYGKQIRDLALASPGSAVRYAQLASETIALDLVDNLVKQLLLFTKLAAAENGHKLVKDVIDRCDEVQKEMDAERAKMADKIKNQGDLQKIYATLMSSQNNPFLSRNFRPAAASK